MTERPIPKDLRYVLSKITSGSVDPQIVQQTVHRLDQEVREGKIRTQLSCEEARREWINMARWNYVDNNPSGRWPIDVEVGAHIARCGTDACENLYQVYYGVLRNSKPEDSSRVAEIVDSLDRSMFGQAK